MPALAERLIDTTFGSDVEGAKPISTRYRKVLSAQQRPSLAETRNGYSDASTSFEFGKVTLPYIGGIGKEAPSTTPQSPASRSLQPLQEWEGYVTEVKKDSFIARLIDVTKGASTEGEVAEFSLSEIREDHLSLIVEGAVFRWVIGYLRSVSGEKQRISDLVFRRLPAWTKRDIDAAKTKAKIMIQEIIWE